MSRGITSDMPEDVCLIQAGLLRAGDEVRFRMPSANYTVEDVETDQIGHVRVHFNNRTASNAFHPGEWLWITRRSDRGGAAA